MTETDTVFDDIFRLLTPERLLRDPRATGEGVSVALIDSGVERSVLQAKFGPAMASRMCSTCGTVLDSYTGFSPIPGRCFPCTSRGRTSRS